MSAPQKLSIYADGGSRGNPGPAGYGAVVKAGSKKVATAWGFVGKATNNVAEYHGMIAGLEAAISFAPAAELAVFLDSKLVVEQMSGRWKVKHPDMVVLVERARTLLKGRTVTFEWIPRAKNAEADALANHAMDSKTTGLESDPPDQEEDFSQDATVEAVTAHGYAGDLTPEVAYRLLHDDDSARLVDVRTLAEWTFVGTPKLTPPLAPLVRAEWSTFPSGERNASFVDQVAVECSDTTAPVILLCRCGGRSAAAARELTKQGYERAYNVVGGFEGDIDEAGHRGVGGWKSALLPWQQS